MESNLVSICDRGSKPIATPSDERELHELARLARSMRRQEGRLRKTIEKIELHGNRVFIQKVDLSTPQVPFLQTTLTFCKLTT